MPVPAVAAATCLSAAIGCILMGIIANYPIALAPGHGPQRVLCLYRGQGDGCSLADRAGLRLSFPAAFFCC
jgi:xanthine/uracil/vitamin C permease (AzgA family)